MPKSVSKKPRPTAVEKKLEMCERCISAWENYGRRPDAKPNDVTDAIWWLHKWHPEVSDRVDQFAERMAALYNADRFSYYGYNFWEI